MLSMDLREIIDKEDIMLDSKKLREFNNRSKLLCNIEEVKHKFIDENSLDSENMAIICKFTEAIKNILQTLEEEFNAKSYR